MMQCLCLDCNKETDAVQGNAYTEGGDAIPVMVCGVCNGTRIIQMTPSLKWVMLATEALEKRISGIERELGTLYER